MWRGQVRFVGKFITRLCWGMVTLAIMEQTVALCVLSQIPPGLVVTMFLLPCPEARHPRFTDNLDELA